MAGARIRHTGIGFSLAFLFALLLALGVAVVFAPLVGFAISSAGFHVPFPRIFDRVVMIAAGCALLFFARPLHLASLLHESFRYSHRSLPQLLLGLAIALAIMAALLAAGSTTLHRGFPLGSIAIRAARFATAALLIGLIEETFFRAILLGGLARDLGVRTALIISAAIYAVAHLIRSPKHYFLVGFHPAAGLHNLSASFARIIHPGDLIAMLLGLFLLGLVLGEAFIRTRQVYLSIGLHAGLVIGAKCWGAVGAGAPPAPRWLAGPGPVPLIAAPAAWIFSLILFVLISRIGHDQES
jgi:membrane protease YdiL (CAAX protease family)